MGTNAISSRRSSVATYFDTLVAIVKTVRSLGTFIDKRRNLTNGSYLNRVQIIEHDCEADSRQ
jgi:hypothetical protein